MGGRGHWYGCDAKTIISPKSNTLFSDIITTSLLKETSHYFKVRIFYDDDIKLSDGQWDMSSRTLQWEETTVSYLLRVKTPVMKGHLSCRDTLSRISMCPLKTGHTVYCLDLFKLTSWFCWCAWISWLTISATVITINSSFDAVTTVKMSFNNNHY